MSASLLPNHSMSALQNTFKPAELCRLKHASAPCLDVGTASKPRALPIEVCETVMGQRRVNLAPKQTTQMIRTAAQKPADRMRFIQNAVTNQAKLQIDPTLAAMGVTVDSKMVEVWQALQRILPESSALWPREVIYFMPYLSRRCERLLGCLVWFHPPSLLY